ncbi:MAG: valine--tRNA ligase, partial [Bacteroidetes bacterium GWE2_29_8]
IDVFIDLYNKGYIYRGVRMVNWDPKALTALSDEEVIYKQVNSKLYYLRYKIDGMDDEWITIATTRPETILGDTAVCVHPEDDRYASMKGKNIYVPLVNRLIPIIFDEYVDREFGTGALKITPAHDINDYNIGLKHNLKVIDIFNDNGTLNEKAELYIGEDRFAVRKKIVKELEEKGFLVKIEDLTNNVGFSERTDEVIEPKLSVQWFCNMSKLASPALEVVMNDTIKFHPAKFKNTYKHWMENIKDWCISRQLWWGHQIPAYYLPDGSYVVAKSKEEALNIANNKSNNLYTINDLRQDEDVLDTWFSSWLWPISVFDGIRNPNNADINYYYPTDTLVTAPEILFFWVARMIMAGFEYKKSIPFKNVYLTGIVRDKQGRKMSKSLGNSPEPIQLIEKYGADGVRVGMLLCSPAGNDLLFDEGLCEQGRNFSNKIWNAFRLVKSWDVSDNIEQPEICKTSIECFESILNKNISTIEDNFEKYRISDALMSIYKLVWDEFCAWYLELTKPAYQQPIDKATYEKTIYFFEELLKLLHPFMPFITEELWGNIGERAENDLIMFAKAEVSGDYKNEVIEQYEEIKEIVVAIRNLRNEKNIPLKEKIKLFIKSNNDRNNTLDSMLIKLCNIETLEYSEQKIDNSYSIINRAIELFIPISENINIEDEIKKLKIDLEYTQGFINSVRKKLSNSNFVDKAPESVINAEKKKEQDALDRIEVIKSQLESFGN